MRTIKHTIQFFYFFLFFLAVNLKFTYSQSSSIVGTIYPFSVDSNSITIWNNEKYVPLFIKGINLGVAVPGTFPSEMAATREQYVRWITQIQDAGFNAIRLYTLHYPRFYEVLDSMNKANPQHPLLFFQGIWLEEELNGYQEDLTQLDSVFRKEILDNIKCVHGNNYIPPRAGKAHGIYNTDVSKWLIGYIAGREVHPSEVITTNQAYPSLTNYEGNFLSIHEVNASEVFIIKHLDYILSTEMGLYEQQHPVSFSSWPTLDPITHPTEIYTSEDIASIDISKVDASRSPAGVFVSYHAYPYYPDFIGKDTSYQNTMDAYGQNSYLAYLKDLKAHYKHLPLIIAECGVPSSIGVAHYAQSGMNHGGFDEKNQGLTNMRIMQNIAESGCGGGISFSWIDEWFKRTWISDPLDFNPDRRILWHNKISAEQNFGLIGFKKLGTSYDTTEVFASNPYITSIDKGSDFTQLKFRMQLAQTMGIRDSIWVGIDTYRSDYGESILPNGKSISNRAEFALLITYAKAELYVTQAYDLFGIWHNQTDTTQLFRSIATDGKPWNMVRLKNNQSDQEVQFIGLLSVNRLGMPISTMDAVIIDTNSIEVLLPWNLINFMDPSTMKVLHDNSETTILNDTISDGVSFSIFYNHIQLETSSRYIWDHWNVATNVEEYVKEGYTIMKQNLPFLPGNPVAFSDTYLVEAGKKNTVNKTEGVLNNDYSFDGKAIQAYIINTSLHGELQMSSDGSFTYISDYGYTGSDSFTYQIISENHRSEPVSVNLIIVGSTMGDGFVTIFPNPSRDNFKITSRSIIDLVIVYDSTGKKILSHTPLSLDYTIDLSTFPSGLYFIETISGMQPFTTRVLLSK